MTNNKVQFLKNVGSGWLAVFVTGLVGFLSLPLNLKYLGKELYGISALAVSALTLFSFLRMGMQPALLRFFSHAVAEKNHEEFKSLSSMAQLLLGGAGFVGGIGFLCTYPWFVSIYEVPETVQWDLLILFLAIAFNFWSNLFLIPFSTIIQAGNRFDVGNLRQCFASILRIVTLFIGYSFFAPSLLILAVSTFIGTVYQLSSLILLAYKIHGNSVFFHRKSLRWNLMLPLFSFSAWNLIHEVFMGLSMQLPVLIIGKTLGLDMVAAFVPAITLSTFFNSIMVQISVPLVPIASKDYVENGGKNTGTLAIRMGEIIACFSCSIVVVFALYGGEIITIWLGEAFSWTRTIVTIMVIGLIFPSIQKSNTRLALGGNASFVPPALSAVAVTVVIALGTLLGTVYGAWSLLEVAVFIAIVRLIRNAFYLSYTYSIQLGYHFMEYTWRVYVKPFLLMLPVIGLFYAIKWQLSFSWVFIPTLVVFALLAVMMYLSLCWLFVLHNHTKNSMLRSITGFLQRLK